MNEDNELWIPANIPHYHKSSAYKLDRKNCLTLDEWNFCFVSWGLQCAVCGSEHYLQGDHWIPRKAGGSSLADNIVPLCRTCNVEKGGSPAKGWLILKFNGDMGKVDEIITRVDAYHEKVRSNGMYKNGARKP
jgi:hypothetical protein